MSSEKRAREVEEEHVRKALEGMGKKPWRVVKRAELPPKFRYEFTPEVPAGEGALERQARLDARKAALADHLACYGEGSIEVGPATAHFHAGYGAGFADAQEALATELQKARADAWDMAWDAGYDWGRDDGNPDEFGPRRDENPFRSQEPPTGKEQP